MAYHLHRLHLRGTALSPTGLAPQPRADIAQARIPVTPAMISLLSAKLGIVPEELTRKLTPQEDRAWSFYRRAARNNLEVWRNAQTTWSARGLSLRQAAQILGCNHTALLRALRQTSTKTLTFEGAQALITALALDIRPEDWLPSRD